MPNQYVRYNNPVYPGATAASPNTVMERDNNGNANAVGLTATSFLESLGALYLAGGSQSGNATLDESATFWSINSTSGANTQTLPAASTVTGLLYFIKKTDSSTNTVTVKGNGSELIDASNTFVLTVQYKYVIVWSNGTQWLILGSN